MGPMGFREILGQIEPPQRRWQTLRKALFGSLLRASTPPANGVNERLTTCSWVYIILIWPIFPGAPYCNIRFSLGQDSYLRTRIFIKTGN
jgi:hypothetical protein